MTTESQSAAELIPIDRQLIQDYIISHSLTTVLNGAVNEVVRTRPDNPLNVLSELLRQVSRTRQCITKSIIKNSFGICDTKLEAEITIGLEKFSAVVPTEKQNEPSGATSDDLKSKFSSALFILSAECLVGADPVIQAEIDRRLRNEYAILSNSISALSIACCKAGASQLNIPQYEHISKLFGQKARIPMPLFGLFDGGSACGGGRCFIKHIMFAPKGESIACCSLLYRSMFLKCKECLTQMAFASSSGLPGAVNTNIGQYGGYSLVNLSPLDSLNAAFSALISDEDGFIAVDIDSEALQQDEKYDIARFDSASHSATSNAINDIKKPPKGKKEVKTSLAMLTTQFKTANEMQEIYIDWLKQYPIGLICNPFSKCDASQNIQLQEKANFIYLDHINMKLKNLKDSTSKEANPTDSNVTAMRQPIFQISQQSYPAEASNGTYSDNGNSINNAFVFEVNRGLTLTEIAITVEKARKNNMAIMISLSQGTELDTEDAIFAANLAVGLSVDYFFCGGLASEACRQAIQELIKIECCGIPFCNLK